MIAAEKVCALNMLAEWWRNARISIRMEPIEAGSLFTDCPGTWNLARFLGLLDRYDFRVPYKP
jgi:hypothetical protein